MDRVFLGSLIFAVALAAPLPKQLAGPASEFASHYLPNPVAAGIEEKSAVLRASLQIKNGELGASSSLPLIVDATEEFAFTIYSEVLSKLTVALADPSGKAVDLSSHGQQSDFPLSDDGTYTVPAMVYLFPAPYPTGTYQLTISCQTCTESSQAMVHLFNDNSVRVFSHVQSYTNSFVGQPIGLASRVTTDTTYKRGLGAPSALLGSVSKAEMDLLTPDGKEIDVPMHDDGLHGDGLANDGVFGATVTATTPGTYVASAVLSGVVDGISFVRTTQQLISVVAQTAVLSGTASAVHDGQQRLTVNIGVSGTAGIKYRAYAEVWGVDSKGDALAVCWIGGVSTTVADGSSVVLPLGLDLQWIAKAGAKAPYTLKNVYVQDISTFLPLTTQQTIPVTLSGNVVGMNSVLTRLRQRPNVATEVTEAMRMGVRPLHLFRSRNATATTTPLVAVHGYCAGGNPFRDHSQYFTNTVYFTDPKANREHDDFANLLSDFAEAQGFTAWAGAGHSQGGIALLHLLEFYWSGLSVPDQGHIVQSVGSPFLGCSAAGSAANLGKAFGVGCGTNYDMSVDGATLWATGLTPETQNLVYFYTTTYKRNQFFGDYCNLAVNLILKWPNDGTTELDLAQLPHGNNMGNTEQQCHTAGMKYIAQTADPARLQAINANRGY